MRECPGCGEQNPDEYAFCPHCGEPMIGPCIEFHDQELRKRIEAILSGTERRLRAVITAFSRYMEAPVVESIITGDLQELQGARRTITVLFSDIRNSSGIIARLDPEEALNVLGRHHDRMAAAVQAYDGLLDKFIGDGMIALFTRGNPQEHAGQAVRAALMMRQYIREANEQWPVPDIPLEVGIAINTGEVLVGSVGSQYRQDYTAVGAEINYVDDLQDACKDLGRDIVLSKATRELLGDAADAEDLGCLARPPDGHEECIYHIRGLNAPSQEDDQ